MDKIVRAIRRKAGFNQEQFAAALKTTVASINRWENGKTIPHFRAQKRLEKLCRMLRMEKFVCDEIIKTYQVEPEGDELILYHGSKQGITGPLVPQSRDKTDFGKGFYLGTNVLQPLTLICGENMPKMYSFKLNLQGLKVLKTETDLTWTFLIAYNRGHMDQYKDSAIYRRFEEMTQSYDIIYGCIADDRMYEVMNSFFNGYITDIALLKSISVLDLGFQYVCKTQSACDRLEQLSERTVTPFELSFLREISAKRKEEGKRMSDEVVRQYRREGKFFDELIEEG